MKDIVQSGSIIVCFISYRDILEANAARVVITHKIYSTKYDDPGIEPQTASEKYENLRFYTAA